MTKTAPNFKTRLKNSRYARDYTIPYKSDESILEQQPDSRLSGVTGSSAVRVYTAYPPKSRLFHLGCIIHLPRHYVTYKKIQNPGVYITSSSALARLLELFPIVITNRVCLQWIPLHTCILESINFSGECLYSDILRLNSFFFRSD